MGQWVKALVTESNSMSLISRICKVIGELTLKSFPDFHTGAMAPVHICTHAKIKFF